MAPPSGYDYPTVAVAGAAPAAAGLALVFFPGTGGGPECAGGRQNVLGASSCPVVVMGHFMGSKMLSGMTKWIQSACGRIVGRILSRDVDQLGHRSLRRRAPDAFVVLPQCKEGWAQGPRRIRDPALVFLLLPEGQRLDGRVQRATQLLV